MPERTLSDPLNASGLAAADRQWWSIQQALENGSSSVAITEGDLLALVWDETTQTIKVALADTDVHDPAMKVGVAAEAIPASSAGMVTLGGFARVNISTGTVAVGERLIMTSTAGVADGAAADATTVEGDTHGVFLGDEIGTTNKAPVWLNV